MFNRKSKKLKKTKDSQSNSLSNIILKTPSLSGINTVTLSYNANPIYYNNNGYSKLLFVITPTAQNGIYLRSYEEIPLVLRSPTFTKPKTIKHNSLTYHYNIETLSIESLINEEDNICIIFIFELSKNQQKTNPSPVITNLDISNTNDELTYDNSIGYDYDGKCNICLEEISKCSKATLNECHHSFCYDCIIKWSKFSSECPICKDNFKLILYGTKKSKKIKQKKFHYTYDEEDKLNDIIVKNSSDYCMVCNMDTDRDVMLICDKCQFNVCHTYCDGLDRIPDGEWICKQCLQKKKGHKLRKKHLV